MEIRCKNCEHVGEAGEVRALPGGVGLVCAQCSHVNPLNLSGSSEQTGATTDFSAASTNKAGDVDGVSADELEAARYLIPPAGKGPRCPKCLALIGDNREHCARCGLKLTEIDRFSPGSAPWELAPPGKIAEFEHAERLWPSLPGDIESAQLDEWSAFVQAQDLLDYAIRKLQLQLIDTPEHPQILNALAKIERKLQQRVFVATTEAELSAKAYSGEVTRLRQRLLTFSLVFWAGILVLFGIVFWGKC